jgi:hypothetical protein
MKELEWREVLTDSPHRLYTALIPGTAMQAWISGNYRNHYNISISIKNGTQPKIGDIVLWQDMGIENIKNAMIMVILGIKEIRDNLTAVIN